MRRGRWRWRWRWVALVAVAAACVLRVQTGERRERVAYTHVPAARLAHLLADFTAHPHGGAAGAGAGAGGWRVEEERGNYTWWWYRVRFACGARCEGEAHVAAGTGAPDTHLVSLRMTLCTSLPLLPWLAYCGESQEAVGRRGRLRLSPSTLLYCIALYDVRTVHLQ